MSDIQPGTYKAVARKVYLETVGANATPIVRVLADIGDEPIKVAIWLPNPGVQDEKKLETTARMAFKSLELVGLDPDTAMTAILEDPDLIAGSEFDVDVDYNERGQMDCRIPLGFDSKPPAPEKAKSIQELLSAVKK